MDYILQLRQFIGHRPILLVGAAVLVLDEQNRLLMVKRSDNGGGSVGRRKCTCHILGAYLGGIAREVRRQYEGSQSGQVKML